MEDGHEIATRSLRGRHKKPSVGIGCCFNGGATGKHRRRASFDTLSSSSSTTTTTTPRSSPRRSSPSYLPEIKDKCRNFISRMAPRHHRRHASADFSYDPLSYSLNFSEDGRSSDDEFRALNFTARLPASPRTTTNPFDNNHFSRIPVPMSPRDQRSEESNQVGEEMLRRGFEALSVSLKKSGSAKEEVKVASPRTAEVRRSLEEVTSPVARISSKREILVQLC